MLTSKESALLDYLLMIFKNEDVMKKATIMEVPNTDYNIGKDINGKVFFMRKVEGMHVAVNPYKWINGLANAIGHGVAGLPSVVEFSEDNPLKVSNADEGNNYNSVEEAHVIFDIIEKFNGDTEGLQIESEKISYWVRFNVHVDGDEFLTNYIVFVANITEVEEDWEDDDLNDPFGYATFDDDLEKEVEELKEALEDDKIEKAFEDLTLGETKVLASFGGEGVSKIDVGGILKQMLESEDLHSLELSEHEQIALSVAGLVDEKQEAYGNSVDKSQRIIAILMEDYKNEDGTYTIPEALIPHLLYQIRIIDKQNRVFSNPEHDLMDESPYQDILGYSLLMLAKQQKEKQ